MMRNRASVALVLLAALLAGCGGVQSVLAPRGPVAADIAALGWVLFAVAGTILLLVVIACWVAVRGSDPSRRQLSAVRFVACAGIAFPVLTLSALLGYGVWLTRASAVPSNSANMTRIAVSGEQWWWRVVYVGDSASNVASANEIRMPVGTPIEFVLTSPDVIHSFWVPSLGGKVDMIPGRTTRLRLQANAPGVFRGQCAEYCGGPHALMALHVVAMPAAEFYTWLAREGRAAEVPHNATVARGQRLFLAAGCGGCHAVRGTEASGVIGPDLTHLASRRSVGVDTLPMTQANLARFIVNGQHVKPGNRMPPFRVLTEAELDAVTSYLMSLE
jgi:cytochrome c oxidase subunit 2